MQASMNGTATRTITAQEPARVPWLSVVLGFGPMLPIAFGSALAWWRWGHEQSNYLVALLIVFYAASILCFLAGVRRGVSFRQPGGATVTQIVTMFGLYTLGLAALVTSFLGQMILAIGCLIAGYAAIAVLDPIAARAGEAPLHFARLRPLQMPIAVLGLAALLVLKWISPY